MSPVVVADVHALWIRLPFEQLGTHLPVVGLRPSASWRLQECQSLSCETTGYQEIDFPLPPRVFGRLGAWLAPFTMLQIRRACGVPKAIVYTFPVHRVYPRWLGRIPSFYYASDDYLEEYGFHSGKVAAWERSLASSVNHVFAVSEALADLLAERHRLPREKFTVVPNGLPGPWIPDSPPGCPAPAPHLLPAHFRPLVGVLGGISRRLRLDWVLQAVEALPWSHWAFVGPIGEMDEGSASTLRQLQAHPRCCFPGGQPYEKLAEFAAAFDVAVIPLNSEGLNPSCSPVRFFTQLPFGQPILATPGCRQLDEYSQVVSRCASADDLISKLAELAARGFDDGLKTERWLLSKRCTWEQRALTIKNVIEGVMRPQRHRPGPTA